MSSMFFVILTDRRIVENHYYFWELISCYRWMSWINMFKNQCFVYLQHLHTSKYFRCIAAERLKLLIFSFTLFVCTERLKIPSTCSVESSSATLFDTVSSWHHVFRAINAQLLYTVHATYDHHLRVEYSNVSKLRKREVDQNFWVSFIKITWLSKFETVHRLRLKKTRFLENAVKPHMLWYVVHFKVT